MTIAIGQLAPTALSVCVCVCIYGRPSSSCLLPLPMARELRKVRVAGSRRSRSPVCLLYSRLEGDDCSSVSTSTGAAKQTHPPRPLCVVFHAAAEIRDNPPLLWCQPVSGVQHLSSLRSSRCFNSLLANHLRLCCCYCYASPTDSRSRWLLLYLSAFIRQSS
jgi:hypothetical protein